MEGEVLSLAFGGYGVIKLKDEIYFISGALPKEIVKFSVDFKRKGVCFGKTEKVIWPSPFRVEPKCKYFLNCGGCHLQNLKYENQINEKEKILSQILKKIVKLEVNLEKPIFSKGYWYRSKVQLVINEDGKICFYKRNSNKLLKINSCPILSKKLEVFIKKISASNKKLIGMKNLALYFSKSIVGRAEFFEKENLEKYWDELKEFSLKGFWISPKNGYGKYLIKRNFDGYFLFHSPFSFMQINENVNKLVVEEILKILEQYKDLKILDAYAGVGNFSIPLNLKFKDLTSLEPSSSNYYLLQRNIEENKRENLKIFKERFENFESNKKFDLILLDPPREGLSKNAIEKILKFMPNIIIYISCEPSKLARDLSFLIEKYKVKFIKLIDMFPQTYHIESMAFLEKI